MEEEVETAANTEEVSDGTSELETKLAEARRHWLNRISSISTSPPSTTTYRQPQRRRRRRMRYWPAPRRTTVTGLPAGI